MECYPTNSPVRRKLIQIYIMLIITAQSVRIGSNVSYVVMHCGPEEKFGQDTSLVNLLLKPVLDFFQGLWPADESNPLTIQAFETFFLLRALFMSQFPKSIYAVVDPEGLLTEGGGGGWLVLTALLFQKEIV